MKITIIATHPIQYHIPWFRQLSSMSNCDVKVYYGCIPDAEKQGTGFKVAFKWDIPLYEDYTWEVLESRKEDPGVDKFFSCSASNLKQIFLRDKPDIVILTGWQSLLLLQALWWSIILGIPRIIRGESNGLKPRRLLVRCVHRFLLHWFHAFLVIGKANSLFYKGYGIDDRLLFPCNYFVENDRIIQQAQDCIDKRSLLRSKWNISRQSICFLYMGKLEKKKRIFDQLAALEMALLDNPDICLLVVGDGELFEPAKQIVKDKQLPVTFTGFLNQTQISQAYVAADCLILSSDYDETWGLVVNEGMACGLPAIVSDRAGCNLDLIQDKITGMTYSFGNIGELAEKISYMAANPDEIKKMGQGARDRLLKGYTVEKATEGTLSAIRSVLGL